MVRDAVSPVDEIGHERIDVDFQDFGQHHELDEIQPALAPFVFLHEALQLAEPLGDIRLGQAAAFPRFYQQRAECPVVGFVQGVGYP